MSKAIVRFLAILGALWLIGMVIVMVAVIGTKGKVPSKTILEANFEQTYLEDVPQTPSAQLLLTEKQTLRDVIDAIDRGASDDRVVGMIAKIGAAPMGMAQTQEIRDAVQRFRAHKKFAVAYAETFGEFGPGNGAYYLATAFDPIYLQPSGDVGLTGILMESPFVKGTLSKLGVTFHGDHRYEYKNALNFYTETKYTGPHKEAMTAIMASWFNQMKDGICQARQIAPEKFQSLVDAGPYLGQEAVDARLVDGVAYRDEVYGKVRSQAGEGAELLYLDKYLRRAGRPHERGKTVALVFGVGGVTRGKSDYDPVQGSQNMGSDTVAGAIRAAAEDKDVKAILFRVDSPGGSVRCLRHHLARSSAGAPGGQAGDCFDGKSGRVGRILCGDGGRQDRGRARNHHGLDRRAGRKDADQRVVGQSRAFVGRSASGPERHHVHRNPRLHARRMGAIPVVARPRVSGFHQQGCRRAKAAEGKSVGDCEGANLVGTGRQEPWLGG